MKSRKRRPPSDVAQVVSIRLTERRKQELRKRGSKPLNEWLDKPLREQP